MGFFPSDWDDEDQDEFDGNVEELVKEFEAHKRDDFSPRELLEIFRFYSFNLLGSGDPGRSFRRIKLVLEKGIDQFPYIPVFAIHMAEVLMREENYRLARKYLAKAKEYNALEPAIFFVEATIAGLEGRMDKARDIIQQGMTLAGEDAAAMEDLLELLFHYQQLELALPVMEKALELNAELPFILEKWLNSLSVKDDVRKLIPVLEMLIDKDPYAEESWYLLGNAHMELENYPEAVHAFDYAVTVNENFLEAWIGYMEALYENENYTEFLNYLAEQEQRFHKSAFEDLMGLKAWCLYETGNTKEARSLYQQVLKRTPEDSESWYSMGLTWHYESNYAAAIPYLQKAWELNPLEADYGIVLAAALFGNGEDDKWQALYEVLAEDFSDEEEVWLDWGVALYHTGERDRALEITQEGLKSCPGSSLLMYRLAALCYLSGQQQAAEFLLENALNIEPQEHNQMFIFAPELKKAGSLLRIIARFTNPGLQQ